MPGAGGSTLREKAGLEAIVAQVMREMAARSNADAPTPTTTRPQTAEKTAKTENAVLYGVGRAPLTCGTPAVQGSAAVETVAEFRERRRRVIAANMRRYRKELGISQGRLAEMIGKPREQVNAWENARWEPTQHLDVIADALGVTAEDLLCDSAETAA